MKKSETNNKKTIENCGGLKPIVLIKPPKKTKETKKTK